MDVELRREVVPVAGAPGCFQAVWRIVTPTTSSEFPSLRAAIDYCTQAGWTFHRTPALGLKARIDER